MINDTSLLAVTRKLRAALCTFGLLIAIVDGASAAEMLVTAEFRPSALDPNRNTFTNTTPLGSYCSWASHFCERWDAYVIDLPVNIISKKYVKNANPRQSLYFALPDARRVVATNQSGTSIHVDIAINSISGHLTPGGDTNPAFTRYPKGGCTYGGTAGNAIRTQFGWSVTTPDVPQPCYSVGSAGENGFTQVYSSVYLGVGLTVTTPSTLGMENGLYRGSLQYTIGGAGSDFDLGDDVQMTDSIVVMNFEFLVAHDFKVERAYGTDTIVLQPENGWRDWVENGRAPKLIRQELPFLMTSSGGFSVHLACEQQVGERCAIRTDSGDSAALDVTMTIPGLYNENSGEPVDGYPLSASGVAPSFRVREYMQNRPSRLGFSVSGDPLRRMLDMPGSRWRGEVTVIFDASP